MVTPGIKGVAILGGTGCHLKAMAVRSKADGAATGIDSEPWRFRLIRIINGLTRISEFFLVTIGANGAFMSEVNPIIHAQQRSIEIVLGVGQRKSGKQRVPD